MAALSGPPSCGPLEPIWRASGCSDEFSCGGRFPSGSPAVVGNVVALSCGRKMFPRRSAEEFLPDNTLCNPAILRRCEREEGRAEWLSSGIQAISAGCCAASCAIAGTAGPWSNEVVSESSVLVLIVPLQCMTNNEHPRKCTPPAARTEWHRHERGRPEGCRVIRRYEGCCRAVIGWTVHVWACRGQETRIVEQRL